MSPLSLARVARISLRPTRSSRSRLREHQGDPPTLADLSGLAL